MGDRLRLRPADIGDLALLRHWDTQAHVLASDPNDDWEWEVQLTRDPPWREQRVAEVGGRPIGFLQIIDPALDDEHYWGEVGPGLRAIDIWIGEAEYLGRGYGTRIMRWAIGRCFADPGVRAILIDPLASNVDAIRFYRRLGFRFVERRAFGADVCDVHELTRDTWQAHGPPPGR